MQAFILLLTVAAGMLMPTQAGINSTFRQHAGHPLLAAVLNFGVGLTVLLTAALCLRVSWPGSGLLAGAPWWSWLGGLCGASLVVISIIAAPRLGAALLVACLMAGQLSASLLIDHFGLVGYPVRPATLSRIGGVLLLAAGVLVLQRSP